MRMLRREGMRRKEGVSGMGGRRKVKRRSVM